MHIWAANIDCNLNPYKYSIKPASFGRKFLSSSFQDGVTPLWIASQTGHTKVVQELLAHGAIVDRANNQGATPLFKAAHKGHVDVVEQLLAHHASVQLLKVG
jgi:ankyrin repeat protein